MYDVLNTGENNVYNIMQRQLTETFSAPDPSAIKNDGLEGRSYRRTILQGFLHENRETLCVIGIFMLCALHLLIRIIFYGIGVAKIDTGYTTGSLVCCIAATLIPVLTWVYSSKLKYFSFHDRKFMLLRFCIATFAFMIVTFIYHHAGNVVIPLVVALFKPTISRSVSMVKMFCRILMLLISIIPGIIIYVGLSHFTRDEIQQYKIINFDISMMIDLRDKETQEFAYDMTIVKDLKNAKPYVIKEKDRFLHALDDGVTGSGKTSSTFTPAIFNDFNQRLYNLEHQKMGAEKLLAEGRARMIQPMADIDFDIDNFAPLDEKSEKQLYKLKYSSPLAGIITIAPNEAFADEVYGLARATGQTVNRLDPMLAPDGRLKEGFKGLNPIYIKPGLTEVQYLIEVNQRATLFADVMQAVYDKSGQSNPYFAGLNQNITTSVTALILLCAPYMPHKFADKGRVPVPTDVQDVLNDFSKAAEYNKVFLSCYAKPGTKRDKHPDFGNLQYIYDVVNGRLLGSDSSQLFDQCQGLRNIINQLLGNPMIRNILCTQNTIDLDHVLAKGEIVIVNYALNLGSDGITFGLFFFLSLIAAAYRRPAPESERLPCFIYADELPQLLHPKQEACFALFRQYRMAMFVAIQSHSQLEKSRDTAFLKQVLLGNCAHHFVFGRAGVEDMEIYMALAGTKLKAVLTESRNETSLMADNPTVSYQHRFTNQRVNNMEGSDIHDLKFQECMVITVNNGTPVAAFSGMVFFLPRWQRTHHKRYETDWSRFCPPQSTVPDESDSGDGRKGGDGSDRQVVVIPRQMLSTDQVEDAGNTETSAMTQQSAGIHMKSADEGFTSDAADSGNPEMEVNAFRFSAGKRTENTTPIQKEENGDKPPVSLAVPDIPELSTDAEMAVQADEPAAPPYTQDLHATDAFISAPATPEEDELPDVTSDLLVAENDAEDPSALLEEGGSPVVDEDISIQKKDLFPSHPPTVDVTVDIPVDTDREEPAASTDLPTDSSVQRQKKEKKHRKASPYDTSSAAPVTERTEHFDASELAKDFEDISDMLGKFL